MAKNSIRVLIVDDSAFARFSISKQIQADPEIQIIDTARNGIEALEKIKKLRPDVVTLDVEMPQMDGLTTLRHIMKDYPTPVVMLSSLTVEGTDTTIKALNRGAVDFFAKPSPAAPAGLHDDVVGDLVEKIKTAAKVDRSWLMKQASKMPDESEKPRQKPATVAVKRSSSMRRVIVLGSSTGGPKALNQVIPNLPGNLPATILMVQHMPIGFTKALAERLNSESELFVKEAEEGDIIKAGHVFLAPGGKHMTVDENGKLHLNGNPSECGLRPAVNVTMDSAVQVYQESVLGVVLTGMGSDGMRGTGLIKQFGGEVVVEHESTCVVYGMPKSVVEAGHADVALPLPQIAVEIIKRCKTVKMNPKLEEFNRWMTLNTVT